MSRPADCCSAAEGAGGRMDGCRRRRLRTLKGAFRRSQSPRRARCLLSRCVLSLAICRVLKTWPGSRFRIYGFQSMPQPLYLPAVLGSPRSVYSPTLPCAVLPMGMVAPLCLPAVSGSHSCCFDNTAPLASHRAFLRCPSSSSGKVHLATLPYVALLD